MQFWSFIDSETIFLFKILDYLNYEKLNKTNAFLK